MVKTGYYLFVYCFRVKVEKGNGDNRIFKKSKFIT